MENVDRITKSLTLKKVVKIFKSNGYAMTSKTIDASYCGVPQKRKRHFLIGEHEGTENSMEFYSSRGLKSRPRHFISTLKAKWILNLLQASQELREKSNLQCP